MKFTLHIGLPKTGTTSLQSMLGRAKDVTFVHRHQAKVRQRICAVLRMYMHTAEERPSLGRWLEIASQDLNNIFETSRTENKCLVVSDENISMTPMELWNWAGSAPEQVCDKLHYFLRDVAKIPGDIQILLGTRDHAIWLASRFAKFGCVNAYKQGFTQHAKENQQLFFEDFLSELAGGRPLVHSLGWLDYKRVSEAFGSAFGARNVKLYSLENLQTHPRETLLDLENFLGTSELYNQSGSTPPENVARVSELKWSFHGFEFCLPQELCQRVGARFENLR